MHADERRRLGERALGARGLSTAVAAGATLTNFLGHREHLGQALFFGGMSALGYAVWVIQSGAQRRDQLRASGRLDQTPPVYGVVQWLRHPALSRRARGLFLADPSLGRLGSLGAARDQFRAERRQAAIAATLRRRIAEGVGPVMADVAVNTFDLDEVAVRITRGADYDGLAALLAAELAPARLAPVSPSGASVVEREPQRSPVQVEAEIEVPVPPASEVGNAEVNTPVGAPTLQSLRAVTAKTQQRDLQRVQKVVVGAPQRPPGLFAPRQGAVGTDVPVVHQLRQLRAQVRVECDHHDRDALRVAAQMLVSRHPHQPRVVGHLVAYGAGDPFMGNAVSNGNCARVPAGTTGAKIVQYAHDIKDGKAVALWGGGPVPYSWGGGHGTVAGPSFGTCVGYTGSIKPCPATSTKGVDCSGFTRWVYKMAYGTDVFGGVNTNGQRARMKKVSSPRPGDLVFFGTSTSNTTHVAVFIGNGRMIEASHTGSSVRESAVSGRSNLIGYYRY